MLAVIILGLIILLIISAFLFNKKTVSDKSKIARKKKKILAITVLGIFVLMIIGILMSDVDGIRSFYCVSGNKCVTVWKKENGEVYIIPGKYKGNDEPSGSYIKTIRGQFLTLYFSEELSHKIIVRDQGNYLSNRKKYTIVNDTKEEWQFLEYSNGYKAILYKTDAVKFKDVKVGTDYIDLDIKENYATDKTGKKL